MVEGTVENNFKLVLRYDGGNYHGWQLQRNVRTIQRLLEEAEQVCFSSDTPFELMRVELAKYTALLEREVTDSGRAMIMGGNIGRLFSF